MVASAGFFLSGHLDRRIVAFGGQVVIHMVFIVSALALAWIDKISQGHLKPSEQADTGRPVAVGPRLPEDREAQAAHYEALARELRSR